MPEQLILVDPDREWSRLDEHTREVGRRGVAEVRRILAEVVDAARAAEAAAAGEGAGEAEAADEGAGDQESVAA